jgi:hypothetical protein
MDDSMTDEDHVRYMLDGGDRGLILRLYETNDSLGFGGGLWIAKEQPLFKDGVTPSGGGRISQLYRRSRFYKQRFELPDTGAKGWAVWFQRGSDPLRPNTPGNCVLCGWVRLDREAEVTGWLDRLNELIQVNLDRAGAPSEEQEREAAAAAHARGSAAILGSLGIKVPGAENMDDLVTKVAELGKDGPIDARSVAKGKAEPT